MNDAAFTPYRICEIELDHPLPALHPQPPYQRQPVLAIVRLHTHPLGIVELDVSAAGLSTENVAKAIWSQLSTSINAHLEQDSLPPLADLPPAGLHCASPACLQKRRSFLSQAPFVSIIVATHNRLASLTRCLDSLLAQDYPQFDIIVVDNAPADGQTAEAIQNRYAATRQVRYVCEMQPGLALAHNRGLSETSAPYVAITDDDVVADRGWLAEIMRGFQLAPDVACVTGMIFPAEIHTHAQFLIERSIGYAKGFETRLFNMRHHRPNDPLYPYAAGRFGSGANMAFDSAVLRGLGGFDENLGAGSPGMGGDDLSAFFEVVAAGYTLVYQPSAIIYHQHHREYERLRKTIYGYGAGLSAYLTCTALAHPRRILDMALRLPRGLVYAFGQHSAKNARKTSDYPPELTRMERRGMLAGPFLYLRGRLKTRTARRSCPALPLPAHPSAHRVEP